MIQRLSILAILVLQVAVSRPYATPMRLIGAMKGDTAGQRLGDGCEGIGDINGDGYNDFLITGRTDRELRLYLGGPHPFDNPPALVLHNHAYDIFSFSPVNIGDIDCDGIDDVASMFGNWDTLKIFTGLERFDSTEYLALLPLGAYSAWDYVTYVTGGGDNNGDGRNDFWLFSYRGATHDTVWGYAGCDLLDSIPDFMIHAPSDLALGYVGFGKLCADCDLNGDGVPEIIIGQPNNASGISGPGRVLVYWGGANISFEADLVFYAPLPHAGNDNFGGAIECLGDISGDGIDDLWVSQGGRNYIYFGGNPFDTIPDVALDWSYMDANVENVGDVNNDGWNDVILIDDSYLINRVSYIYGGPDMDTLVDVVYSDFDFYAATHLGSVCCVGIDHSWAGDIDGDGIDDILISGRTEDVDANDFGFLFIQAGWDSIPTSVTGNEPLPIPDRLQLGQNFPNPFNPGTTIDFSLPRAGYAEVKIYNLLGEVVAIPLKQYLPAGNHRITWDGLTLDGCPAASGIYFYRLTAGLYSDTRKMILLK